MIFEYSGYVRRNDLGLRARYPHLQTVIYRLPDNSYQIYSANYGNDFDAISEVFQHSIRFVTTPVSLTKEIPIQYTEIIPCILDTEISKNFEGIGMTLVSLFNLVVTKFPDIYTTSIFEKETGKIEFHVSTKVEIKDGVVHNYHFTPSKRIILLDFLTKLNLGLTYNIIDIEDPEVNDQTLRPREVYLGQLGRKSKLEFEKRDEAIWFDNIDKVFNNEFNKDQLYFYDSKSYACYVDYSVFDGIDLRNHLFLFQVIYLTPPIQKPLAEWLGKQKIFKNEFLQLLQRGRIKLVLTKHNFDRAFLQEAYEAAPDSVITQRSIALLMQLELVQVADNYIFKDQNIIGLLKATSEEIGTIGKINPRMIYDFLTWPLRARRIAFDFLNTGDLKAIPAFGVNNTLEKLRPNNSAIDLSFELTVTSPSIHIATALNSTYFPSTDEDGFSDYRFTSAMGELLNFYKCATPSTIHLYLNQKLKQRRGSPPINPIEVIKLNDFVSITELEEELSRNTIYPGSQKLMNTLGALDMRERKEKVKFYNNEVKKKLNRRRQSAGIIDLGSNAILDGAGAWTGISVLGSILASSKIAGRWFRRKIPVLDKLVEVIEEKTLGADKANIHYLTKINRVARLKVEDD